MGEVAFDQLCPALGKFGAHAGVLSRIHLRCKYFKTLNFRANLIQHVESLQATKCLFFFRKESGHIKGKLCPLCGMLVGHTAMSAHMSTWHAEKQWKCKLCPYGMLPHKRC